MRPEQAEAVALEALSWLAASEPLLAGFLDASGSRPGDLRARAGDPAFLGFVLDFLLADEAMLLAFCENRATSPETPLKARAALPGGDLPHWT